MTKILTLSLNLYALATRYFLSVFIRPGLDSLDLHCRFSWFLHDMLRLSHTHAHKHNHTLIFYEYHSNISRRRLLRSWTTQKKVSTQVSFNYRSIAEFLHNCNSYDSRNNCKTSAKFPYFKAAIWSGEILRNCHVSRRNTKKLFRQSYYRAIWCDWTFLKYRGNTPGRRERASSVFQTADSLLPFTRPLQPEHRRRLAEKCWPTLATDFWEVSGPRVETISSTQVQNRLNDTCPARQGSALDGGGGELVQSRNKKGQKWKQREGERPPAFVAVASVAGTARYTALSYIHQSRFRRFFQRPSRGKQIPRTDPWSIRVSPRISACWNEISDQPI